MSGPVTIWGLGTALPRLSFTQEEIYRLCGYPHSRYRGLFERSGIETRHLYFGSRAPRIPESADEMHERYRRGALEIGGEAARKALEAADLSPERIGLVVSTSCTGYLCPDLATRLAGPLGLPRGIERAGLQGMGCGGAMPALQRAADFVSARGGFALVVASEICSAAYDLDDDPETALGNALCGDGAAAAVLGPPRPGALLPRIRRFRSILLPEHLEKVGFAQRGGRLRIVLREEIRDLAPGLIARAVEEALAEEGLEKEEIALWALHPGGRRIVEELPAALGLPASRLEASTSVLRRFGNMSSPTVLFVLDEALHRSPPEAGDWGVLLALGPGLAAEAALLRWESA